MSISREDRTAEVIVDTDANGIERFVHVTSREISFKWEVCNVDSNRAPCLGYTAEVDMLILAFNRPVGSKHPFDTDTGNPPPPVIRGRVLSGDGAAGESAVRSIVERDTEIVIDATEGDTARSVKQDGARSDADTAAQGSKPTEP